MDSKKRAVIKKYANRLKPTVIIGAEGLHDNVVTSINNAFNTNEVLKVKVNRVDIEDKNIVREIANEIEKRNNCDIIGVIGTTIIIYKAHKDADKRMF